MTDVGIHSEADIIDFFKTFNEHDYETLFEKYMAEDCFWYASEKALKGKQDMLDYWTKRHSAFRETLGQPENIVFGDGKVYLQVKIRLDFDEDGAFFGKAYNKGDVCNFGCADYYEFNNERKIKTGIVYIKFFN